MNRPIESTFDALQGTRLTRPDWMPRQRLSSWIAGHECESAACMGPRSPLRSRRRASPQGFEGRACPHVPDVSRAPGGATQRIGRQVALAFDVKPSSQRPHGHDVHVQLMPDSSAVEEAVDGLAMSVRAARAHAVEEDHGRSSREGNDQVSVARVTVPPEKGRVCGDSRARPSRNGGGPAGSAGGTGTDPEQKSDREQGSRGRREAEVPRCVHGVTR